LVEPGAALNGANENCGTPQLQTAIKSTTEIFRYVTKNGAEIKILNVYSNVALHIAAYSVSVKVIKIIKSVHL